MQKCKHDAWTDRQTGTSLHRRNLLMRLAVGLGKRWSHNGPSDWVSHNTYFEGKIRDRGKMVIIEG